MKIRSTIRAITAALSLLPLLSPGVEILAGPILNPANGHYYCLLTRSGWTAAENRARSLGGHLVTIDDAAENDWVFREFASYSGVPRLVWIGLTDMDTPGRFQWVGGKPVSYENWSPVEPNNIGSERFAMMYPGGLPQDEMQRRAGSWNNLQDSDGDLGLPAHGVIETESPPREVPFDLVVPKPNLRIASVSICDEQGATIQPSAGQPFSAIVHLDYVNPGCLEYTVRAAFQSESLTLPPIDWGCAQSGSARVQVDVRFNFTPREPGAHPLTVEVDANHQIQESDETDNVRAFDVSVNAAPRLRPNLSFGSLTLVDTAHQLEVNPIPDFPFAFILRHSYANPLCTPYLVKVEMEGTTALWETDGGCGTSGTFHSVRGIGGEWWVRRPGVHEVTITLDPDHRIAESDETDNRKTLQFTSLPAVFDFSRWDAILQSHVPDDGAGGYAWIAMHAGKVIGSGARGYARAPWEAVSPGKLLTPTNQFMIGSSSKTVTGIGLFKVWQESGKSFSLDGPFWPLLRNLFPDVDEGVKRVTFRHLLAGKSGIADRAPNAPPGKETIRSLLRQPLVAEPGTRYSYPGPGNELFAYIMEELSGEKYSEYIRKHVLLPMGITNMDVNPRESAPALGYLTAEGRKPGSLTPVVLESSEVAGGGWWASAVDFARFLTGLREYEILSKEDSEEAGLNGGLLANSVGIGLVPGSYKSCFAIRWDGLIAVLHINSEKPDVLALMTEALGTTTFPLELNRSPGSNPGAWSFFAPAGATYSIEHTDRISSGNWSPLNVVKGDNTAIELPAPDKLRAAEFIRVRRN